MVEIVAGLPILAACTLQLSPVIVINRIKLSYRQQLCAYHLLYSEPDIKMTEELGNQIQGMFKSIYEATDLKYMRPIKRQMFKCGHDCMDDRNSVKQAEQCIDLCGQPMNQAMNVLQTEINAFQGRIDRCLMNCQDDVRNEKDEATAKNKFEACAEKCVKQFVPVVPEVVKTLCEKLDQVKKEHKIR